MGPGETIGLVAVVGLLIAVLVAGSQAFKRWVAYKQRKLELMAEANGARQAARQDDYVDLLEERVRVLERIATDRTPDLARQIEALRDAHQLDERS